MTFLFGFSNFQRQDTGAKVYMTHSMPKVIDPSCRSPSGPNYTTSVLGDTGPSLILLYGRNSLLIIHRVQNQVLATSV